ncbi:unnamed protein product [Dibothriocephalus latus]|uniref:Uncharacterized protein n=1 Tax=Dibothriocephalus latus TaxID=60516 RepID=A0A3P7M5J0_DIBLA|nr:unnamed protein product [Dibothriocephalus latus]
MDREILREAAGDSHRYPPGYLKNLAEQCVTGTPSFSDFFNKTLISVWEFCFHPDRYPYSFTVYRRLWYSFTLKPFIVSLVAACILTGLRKLLRMFFLSTKVGKRFTDEKQKRKALTPLWNALSYSVLFVFDCHVVLNININDFLYPLCIFDTIRYKSTYAFFEHNCFAVNILYRCVFFSTFLHLVYLDALCAFTCSLAPSATTNSYSTENAVMMCVIIGF